MSKLAEERNKADTVHSSAGLVLTPARPAQPSPNTLATRGVACLYSGLCQVIIPLSCLCYTQQNLCVFFFSLLGHQCLCSGKRHWSRAVSDRSLRSLLALVFYGFISVKNEDGEKTGGPCCTV